MHRKPQQQPERFAIDWSVYPEPLRSIAVDTALSLHAIAREGAHIERRDGRIHAAAVMCEQEEAGR